MRTSGRNRSLVAASGLTLITTALAIGTVASGPAQAAPDGGGLVISEAYGGGGNSGATLTHDFVELYNPTDTVISVEGWSVQYRSAGGDGAGQVTPLTGEVPPGGHYLVQQAQGAGGSTALPTPDATGSTRMAGGGGQVWLASTTTPLTPPQGDVVGTDQIVDFVGASSTAASYETAAVTTSPDNPTSVARNDGADSDDNAADFTVGDPTPRNAAGEGGGEDPGPPQDATIAEIQGTGDASPLAGRIVTTTGVVTAVYPGRFNGFFLQTGGTGDGSDDTPGASDGVFVYGPAFEESTLTLGDSVEVRGEVSEYQQLTEVTAETVTPLSEPLDPVMPAALAYPGSSAEREAHEGELLAPTDTFTVTNTYTTNQYAEIGLARGDTPLIQPTDVARPGTAAYDEVVADNAARAVTLDDGSSIDFLDYGGPEQDIPLPWLSAENPVRVGAEASITAPVVLDYRFGGWRFQPQQQVTDEGTAVAHFEDTREENQAPQDVGGGLTLGTFNVLNYFNTTGEDYEAAGGTCTYYTDRDGNPIGTDRCSAPDGSSGPRGAADEVNFERQEAKIVAAINGLGADIVSLEELENSITLLGETDRDDAIAELVGALNEDAGSNTWAYVASPAEASEPANVAQQDVIRSGFIYRVGVVEPVGDSDILFGSSAFSNAREPLAQAFKPAGAPDSSTFAVVANHFKSKGCSGAEGGNADAGDGQGCYNADRIDQARALVGFADEFATSHDTERVFLTGDFNSYTHEDPMQVLYDAGYAVVDSDSEGDWSYSYSGLSGSLDHVLGNAAAIDLVTGADVWEINANESVAFQYSRFNYNATDFYAPDQFAASDHNPEIVGLDVPTGPLASTVSAPDLSATRQSALEVEATVTTDGAAPTGVVELRHGETVLASAEVVDGTASLVVPRKPFKKEFKRGSYHLTLVYSGDETVAGSTGGFALRVTNPAGR